MYRRLFSYVNRYVHVSSYIIWNNFHLGISIYREYGINITLYLGVLDLHLRIGRNHPQIIKELNSVSGY
jgi:hypothetical protein